MLTTHITVKLERADYQFRYLFEQILKSPIAVFEEGKDKPCGLHDIPYPDKEKEVNLRLVPLIYGKTYTVTAKNHTLTEEEKKDGHSAGIDIIIRDSIYAPYEEKTSISFKPLIDLCKLYGFCSYEITNDYSDEVIKKSFNDSECYPILRDVGRNQFLAANCARYFLEHTEGFHDWEKLITKTDDMFEAYISDRKDHFTKQRKENAVFAPSEAEIKYEQYSGHSYNQYLTFLSWNIYCELEEPDITAFTGILTKNTSEKQYMMSLCAQIQKYDIPEEMERE